ncbi:MAG TPA: M48 family metalloprotease [Terriglobia bacterium]|nr:M48 family metalloprotease [Terriglobia bacterium]
MKVQSFLRCVFAISLCVSAAASLAVESAYQFDLKPGFNFFSKQQDISAGKDAADKVEQQLPMLNDRQVLQYLDNLGHRLTQFEPLPADYAWSFKVINAKDINAFALPGGFIYVNRGAIEAAENEAQLAGVIAHETGHVVMRHGTHQASQMLLAQAPLSILGGMMGSSGNLMGQLAQMGVGFTVNSVLLHNSRNAESQADEVGTYVLYHAGYDPHAMAQFFKIIEEKYPAKTAQFFSDHPIPANRIQAIDDEIPKLGPPIEGRTDSPEFENIKHRLMGLPASSPQVQPGEKPSAGPMGPVARAEVMPAANFKKYEHTAFIVSYPANWEVSGDADSALTIAPRAGVAQNAIAYGAMVNWYQSEGGRGGGTLDDNTHQLIDSLRQANPGLKSIGQDEDIRVSNAPGKSIEMTGPSPIQDSSGHAMREHDWLVTVQRSDGSLLYMVFIAPEQDFQALRPAFQKMVRSLQIK